MQVCVCVSSLWCQIPQVWLTCNYASSIKHQVKRHAKPGTCAEKAGVPSFNPWVRRIFRHVYELQYIAAHTNPRTASLLEGPYISSRSL